IAIGDDRYSTRVIVPGLEVGTYSIAVQAVDSFGVEVTFASNISVVNQAPRLIHAEISPTEGPRGTNMVVNLQAYDGHGVANISLDLREFGGDLIELSNNSGVWTTMMVVPDGMSPGQQILEFVLVDGLGKTGLSSVYFDAAPSLTHPNGPHYIPSAEPILISIN
ncbi:MAG TPA: hypothetical protein HA327_05560, partial [Candidatus Poseidoniaceae archaeon]